MYELYDGLGLHVFDGGFQDCKIEAEKRIQKMGCCTVLTIWKDTRCIAVVLDDGDGVHTEVIGNWRQGVMKFKICSFVTGLNDWLRYYVVSVERNEKYLRKDGTIQDSTGLNSYRGLHLLQDTPDSGNFPTIKDAIKAIESVGGTYEFCDSITHSIFDRIRNLPDEKLAKILIEIEESCGPL